jgi:hypothetical protein
MAFGRYSNKSNVKPKEKQCKNQSELTSTWKAWHMANAERQSRRQTPWGVSWCGKQLQLMGAGSNRAYGSCRGVVKEQNAERPQLTSSNA